MKPYSFKNSILTTVLTGCLVACTGAKVAPSSQVESTTALQTTQQTKSVNGDEQAKSKDKIVCKSHKPLGSRIPKRQCMSKQGWDRVAEASKHARDKVNKPTYNRVNPPN